MALFEKKAHVCPRPIHRILLAEDNQLNSEIMHELMGDDGYEVMAVHNGQELVNAFKDAADGYFDAILMDLEMPIMDGFEAAEKVRAMKRLDSGYIPIFACTANVTKEDRDRAAKSGMDEFITKPVDFNALDKKLKSYGK